MLYDTENYLFVITDETNKENCYKVILQWLCKFYFLFFLKSEYLSVFLCEILSSLTLERNQILRKGVKDHLQVLLLISSQLHELVNFYSS